MSDADGVSPGGGTDGGAGAQARPADLDRLRTEFAFHQRLRDLTVAFTRDVSSAATMGGALEAFAFEANTILGARRTTVWLHQRRAHVLNVAACSDGGSGRMAAAVPTDAVETPAARGLRLDRPLVLDGGTPMLLAPLRGWRRALGTLVVEGPFTAEFDRAQLVDLTQELTRQLSASIENVQLLEEILRQRRLLEDTFNSLVDLVVVTDDGLRVVQMNEAFVTRVGLSRAELFERPLDALVGGEMAAWAAAAGASQENTNPQDAFTQRFDDPCLRGTFIVTMTTLITAEGEPGGRVLIARDVTEQTRLENEREALRERLAQSEKLAALGQFVAGIAHEMNNPLQGVLGHLELMMETEEAAKPLKKDLRRIFQEADRAAKIVRNLLVFTGSRRLARRKLRLKRIVSRALASRAAALSKSGITVVRAEADDLPWIDGDPLLLHQAFLNVLMNAEQAVLGEKASGTIRVEARFDAARSTIVATVHDSGPGIPSDILPRIFDPFFTTKDVGKGTGLGLAITYGILQEHGGAIHAANHRDGGAVFTFELPAV